MLKRLSKILSCLVLFSLILSIYPSTPVKAASEKVVLRVANWEEYIDLGDWDEDEAIELDEDTVIFGENTLYEDFEEWYKETYGIEVEVEYSTFGTNEDLYSQLNLGDVFDVVCPSDYMIMKLMDEDKLVPLSDQFFDHDNENNYYVNCVSPYIDEVFRSHDINGKYWDQYAAGYMWGITGFIYNPDEVEEEAVNTWDLLRNPDYFRKVTVKDNVRDAYFPTLAILYKDQLTNQSFLKSDNYDEEVQEIMNDTSESTIANALDILQDIRANVYSFETDSGKADMVTGKVVASLQWSGDAVYAMDQAEEDDVYLNFAVPEEVTNLWFDGWVLLKAGVQGSPEKQHAAEAFINFLSRPDNAIRNMYYIGYTSSISGGDSDLVFNFIDYMYGAEEDEEDTVDYPLGYFFSEDEEDENYVITAPAEQLHRQLFAQYPSKEALERKAIMEYFPQEDNARINQMWIEVRCFDISEVSVVQWIIAGLIFALIIYFVVYSKIIEKK